MEKTGTSHDSVDLRLSHHANHVRQLSLLMSRLNSLIKATGSPLFCPRVQETLNSMTKTNSSAR